jgi:phage tail-like protein
MSLQPGESLTTHRFGIQIDGVGLEYLQSISGYKTTQDVIELKQNSASGKPVIKKMPGGQQAGEVTVVYGVTSSRAFYEWHKLSQNGNMGAARKNATIIFYDSMMTPVKRYHLTQAWCSNVTPGDVRAGEASALTETATIVYEDLVPE